MGLAMASNLQSYLSAQSQPPLRFWNRTPCKGDGVTSLGGKQCDSIAAVVRDSAIIFISTSNDDALQTIMAEILSAGNLTDKIIVDTTTVHPNTSKAVSTKLAEENAFLISGPIFGSAPMAAERKILMVTAGAPCMIHRISPYIKGVIARDMLEVAEKPEKASLLKIIGNFLVSGLTEIVGEAHKSEMGCEVVEKLLEAQFGPLPTMISKRLTQGIYMPRKGTSPWSNLDLALKDVDHAIDCAAAVGIRLPVGEIVLEHLQRAKLFSQQEDRHLDSAASYGIIRCDAGLDFENDFVKKRDA
ncbi:SNF2-related protein [Penicillium atrosanguineum]|uniref:6-phosphogluconate dehydrogenase NADP-binding domain-containing protein n=1 Tax=Penicillium atrosanguineum TaxID=1132637 RepID=A0A9W9PR75_9EURO|nr:SNF2-related protein [Penicillium atrosanguineum]KAJ5289651.1 SNF2-related protein [Penicillium atrosanguineum]KAJ5307470.1 hypothetical protein N7476_008126 [Penicillium atrosanguineum]